MHIGWDSSGRDFHAKPANISGFWAEFALPKRKRVEIRNGQWRNYATIVFPM